MRRFSALLEEYEDMPKDQRMMVYMMWEEVAKDDPQVRALSSGSVFAIRSSLFVVLHVVVVVFSFFCFLNMFHEMY